MKLSKEEKEIIKDNYEKWITKIEHIVQLIWWPPYKRKTIHDYIKNEILKNISKDK